MKHKLIAPNIFISNIYIVILAQRLPCLKGESLWLHFCVYTRHPPTKKKKDIKIILANYRQQFVIYLVFLLVFILAFFW